jgi:hypothetical protein
LTYHKQGVAAHPEPELALQILRPDVPSAQSGNDVNDAVEQQEDTDESEKKKENGGHDVRVGYTLAPKV